MQFSFIKTTAKAARYKQIDLISKIWYNKCNRKGVYIFMKNYELIETKDLAHIGAKGQMYEHASGARIMHIKNDDTNKVFSITFKTPPPDNTGIAHILEHVVLAGSEKYPLKDPFMQLANGSLYTYLNAMTYPDRTVYPVASTNDADFLNLVDVYCDAVFFPLIYKREHGFAQEGWHYKLNNKEDELTYNGVVYNEMKGAFSDPYRLLFATADEALFPNTAYKYDSGGDPDHIPELTKEAFLNFHKTLYHPENAMIYYYGDMDISSCLQTLHDNYLSKFEKKGNYTEINEQAPLSKPAFVTKNYSVSQKENLDENYMSATYVFSSSMPLIDVAALKVLNYILLSTPASPLYKAMIEAEIGEDISGGMSSDLLHPSWGISLQNGTLDGAGLKDFIESSLQSIAQDGLNQDFVLACLNYLEFQAKEEDYGASTPKGLVYSLRTLTRWTYGKCPFEALHGILHLEQIRELNKEPGYFEGLISKYLLNNNHSAFVTIEPMLNLDNQKEEALQQKLAKIKSEMTQKELDQIIQTCKELAKFQETPDTPAELALIPRLAVADIKKQIEQTPLNVLKNTIHSPLETNGIVYTTMMFNMQAVPQHLLPATSILQYILSKLSTKNMDTQLLTQSIKASLGGLGFSVDVSMKISGDFTPFALVSAKFLEKNADEMFSIVNEIIKNTVFTDKTKIKNYVTEIKAAMDDKVLTSGTGAALTRSMSYFSLASVYQEFLGGMDFYNYLKNLCDDFDSNFNELCTQMQEASKLIYNKHNVSFVTVANDELYKNFASKLEKFTSTLDNAKLEPAKSPGLTKDKNEAFATSSKVQYCVQSGSFANAGFEYTGTLRVLANVLDNYLYEEIRAKGGAYGCGTGFTNKGTMHFFSYRDPKLCQTYETFASIPGYIKELDLSDLEVEKFILGAIRALDRPASNAQKGLVAASNHLQGLTDQMRQKERDEVLAANLGALKSLADLAQSGLDQNNICTFGSSSAIQKSELFNSVNTV